MGNSIFSPRQALVFRSQILGLWGIIIGVVTAVVVFIAKQLLNDPKKKAQEDKALLKELLESFGLEIPAELEDSEGTVMKSIEGP